MSSQSKNLIDHRLVIVTGKGGVGKTTVACCLAEAARRAGKKVLLMETAPLESVTARFEIRPEPLGYQGRSLRPGLHALRIDPHEALADYLRLQMGLGLVTDRLLTTDTFRQLLEAAPGWQELIILGKIWHLEQKRDERGAPFYDLLVIDAPATGHGLTFLDVPRVVQSAVRAGPLTRHAGWVEAMVHDRERALLLPVTLPEELPVSETIELVTRARESIDIGVDRIVVNRLPARPTPALREATDALPATLVTDALPPVASLRELVGHADSRAALAFAERARVSLACDLPLVDLPARADAYSPTGAWEEDAKRILDEPARPETAGFEASAA